MREKHSTTLNPDDPRPHFEKVIRESLDYLYEHKPIVQNVLTMALYDEVTDIIYEQLYEGMKAQIQFEIRHGVEFNVDIDILADFYCRRHITYNVCLDSRRPRTFNR